MLGVINWTRLLVKRRQSQVLSTSSTDDGRQYIRAAAFCWSKLTCCEDRRALSKFSKSMQSLEHTVPQKSAFILEDRRIFFTTQCRTIRSLQAVSISNHYLRIIIMAELGSNEILLKRQNRHHNTSTLWFEKNGPLQNFWNNFNKYWPISIIFLYRISTKCRKCLYLQLSTFDKTGYQHRLTP